MNEIQDQPKKASFWKSEPFKVIELSPVPTPAGGNGDNWYRYVISQGDKPIEGLRQGSLASVTAAVDDFVLRLNERRLGTATRAPYSPGPRKGARAAAAAAQANPEAEED